MILLRFISSVILGVMAYYLLHFTLRGLFAPRRKQREESEAEELVQDPHCLLYIPKRQAIKKRISGRDYYFCNQTCLKGFLEQANS